MVSSGGTVKCKSSGFVNFKKLIYVNVIPSMSEDIFEFEYSNQNPTSSISNPNLDELN